jgi:phage portal protein BeeE
MPPHKLGEYGRATYANASIANTQYYNECLRAWLVRWEQAINLFLLGPDHPEWYAEHEISGLLRGDFTQQTDGFRTLLAAGVHSINEVRGYLNLNSIPGGDKHFIQINQATVQHVAEGMKDPPQQTPVKIKAKE